MHNIHALHSFVDKNIRNSLILDVIQWEKPKSAEVNRDRPTVCSDYTFQYQSDSFVFTAQNKRHLGKRLRNERTLHQGST